MQLAVRGHQRHLGIRPQRPDVLGAQPRRKAVDRVAEEVWPGAEAVCAFARGGLGVYREG